MADASGQRKPGWRSEDTSGHVLKWDYPALLAEPSTMRGLLRHLKSGTFGSQIAFFPTFKIRDEWPSISRGHRALRSGRTRER